MFYLSSSLFNDVTLSDLFSLISLIISLISGSWFLIQYIKKKQTEKMRLIITPIIKVSDTIEEIFSLYIAFSNESSLPISLINMKIQTEKHGEFIPNTMNGLEGGTLLFNSAKIIDQSRTHIHDYKKTSLLLPITIAPYQSIGGFVSFNAGGESAKIITYRNIKLEIYTSRGTWTQTINVNSDNFSDFSYDGEKVFGKAVTSITKIERLRIKLKKF